MHKHLFACIRNWNCFDKYKGPSIKKHIFEINRIVIFVYSTSIKRQICLHAVALSKY